MTTAAIATTARKSPEWLTPIPYGFLRSFWSKLKGPVLESRPVSDDLEGQECERVHARMLRLAKARLKLARKFSSPCVDPEDVAQEAVLDFLEKKRSSSSEHYAKASAAATTARTVHASLGAATIPSNTGDAIMEGVARRDWQHFLDEDHRVRPQIIPANRMEHPSVFHAMRFIRRGSGGLNPGRYLTNLVDPKSLHDVLHEREFSQALVACLEAFPDARSRSVFMLRQGLVNGLNEDSGRRSYTLHAVGEIHGVTRERIRGIEAGATRDIQRSLRRFAEIGDLLWSETLVVKDAEAAMARRVERARAGNDPWERMGLALELYATRGFELAQRLELGTIHRALCTIVEPHEAIEIWLKHGITPGPECRCLRSAARPVLHEAVALLRQKGVRLEPKDDWVMGDRGWRRLSWERATDKNP